MRTRGQRMVFKRDTLNVSERLTDDPDAIRYSGVKMTVPAQWGDAELQIGRDTVEAIIDAAPDRWLDE